MPFKTQWGSHYHEVEGCCGATIQCDVKGLEPCAICCGKASSNVRMTAGFCTSDEDTSGINDQMPGLNSAQRRMATAKAVFEEARAKEFTERFRQAWLTEFRLWWNEDYPNWLKRHEKLRRWFVRKMQDNPRYANNAVAMDKEIRKRMRQRYMEENPFPNKDLYRQMKRSQSVADGSEVSWPGYAETKRRWDSETELAWNSPKGEVNASRAEKLAREAQKAYDSWAGRRKGNERECRRIIANSMTGETISHGGAKWEIVDKDSFVINWHTSTSNVEPVLATDKSGTPHQFVRVSGKDIALRSSTPSHPAEYSFVASGGWLDITDINDIQGVTPADFAAQYDRLWL